MAMQKWKFIVCSLSLTSTIVSGILTFSTAAAIAQGVPHLSVDTPTYHTLIPPGTLITKEMCPSGSNVCLKNVGKPLLSPFGPSQGYATDAAGNIYIVDLDTNLLVKVSPEGQPIILAGAYDQFSQTYPPLTAPASWISLSSPTSPTTDTSGNVYIGTGDIAKGNKGTYVIIKIDPQGIEHRLTAPFALATPTPVEGALASTQYVSYSLLATDPEGNLYIADNNTCTIRVLSAQTGRLNTIAGSLAEGCNLRFATTFPQKATSVGASAQALAVGADGTVYFINNSIYSITSDGNINLVVKVGDTGSSAAGAPVVAGPLATYGRIGVPAGNLGIDPAGNLYFNSIAEGPAGRDGSPSTFNANLVELTKGTPSYPSEVLILTTGIVESIYDNPVLNPEGMPAYLATTVNDVAGFALDPSGRIIMTSQFAYTPKTAQAPFGVAYFDRNAALVFGTNAFLGRKYITLSNSGSAPLKTVNIANTGYPFYLVPTAAEIQAAGASGPPPFSIDQTNGTCLARFAPTRSLTLEPGESCTLFFDYTANPNIPQAGAFTLYTNDPRGPLTVALSATHTTVGKISFENETSFGSSTANYYGLNISSTVLTPSSISSTTGNFTISASVASSVYNPSYYPVSVGNLGGMDDVPVIPTGNIYAAVSNDATGAVTLAPTKVLDANGNASFTFTGLTPGTYSLQGVYQGDGSSAPSYSNVQTLTVTPR